MKDAVVRARVDSELKKQASAVLEANALGMSDGIRIFLQQVVRCGGLPFAVRDPAVRVVSDKQLRAMKRAAQVRDRKLNARGEVPPETMLMLRPQRLKGARVEWPDDLLLDEILRSCEGRALLVGGQALAFWAQHYGVTPPGVLGANVTSDADLLGSAQVARPRVPPVRAEPTDRSSCRPRAQQGVSHEPLAPDSGAR